MSMNMADKMKKVLTAKALQAIQELDQEGCVTTLDLGLRWVLEGDRPTVIAEGWQMLHHLKEFQQSTIAELLNVALIEKLLGLDTSSRNRTEVSALVAWNLSVLSSHVSPNALLAMEEVVGSRITDFLRKSVQGDINVLVSTSKLLCEYPCCIPVGDERARLCEVVIENIAEVPVPKPQSTQVSQLIKQMQCVGKLLVRVWKDEAGKSNEELMFRSLGALHAVLIDRPTEPCPALAAVLHLVDPYLIPKSVRAILQAKQGHSRTLRTLCDWLLRWHHASCLSPWVLALMDGLEAERQLDVLKEVTLATVEGLFLALMLPAVRPGVIDVVWRMFVSCRHSPQVFNKVLSKIPSVMVQLLHEGSESSRACLQMVVNMTCAMMTAFPRNDDMYNLVIGAMKDCSSFLPPGQFVSDDAPSWLNELDYTKIYKAKERLSLSRVGLNNLGNSCYMNSVLQALFMTHRFCCAVLQSDAQSQPLLSELQALFALLLHSRRQAISPTELLAVARPPGFQHGFQQDSSEFLTYMLDMLHEQEKLVTTVSDVAVIGGRRHEGAEGGAMTRWTTEEDLSNQNILQCKACSLADFTHATGDDVQQLSNSHSSSTDSGIQSVCGDEAAITASSLVPYESLVQQCFSGRLLISFKCLECQAESVHTDHFRDIQLAFPPDCSPDHELHIQDLLDYFVLPEQLSGENQYHCDTCGGLQDAQRTIQILQSPSHLILTLKRFQFNSKTGQRAKLLHWVQCSESIELSQQSYRLYAAVVHSGSSMDTGHYYTLARDETLVWRIFNDSLVAPCNPPPWSPPDTPYILFYARPEEKLQPAVDLLALPPLQSHLMELVHCDDIEWLKEEQSEEERCRKRRKQRASRNPDRDSDNGGNPPGGCGGGSMDVSHNRFVF